MIVLSCNQVETRTSVYTWAPTHVDDCIRKMALSPEVFKLNMILAYKACF